MSRTVTVILCQRRVCGLPHIRSLNCRVILQHSLVLPFWNELYELFKSRGFSHIPCLTIWNHINMGHLLKLLNECAQEKTCTWIGQKWRNKGRKPHGDNHCSFFSTPLSVRIEMNVMGQKLVNTVEGRFDLKKKAVVRRHVWRSVQGRNCSVKINLKK
jgi:hypothetical protein